MQRWEEGRKERRRETPRKRKWKKEEPPKRLKKTKGNTKEWTTKMPFFRWKVFVGLAKMKKGKQTLKPTQQTKHPQNKTNQEGLGPSEVATKVPKTWIKKLFKHFWYYATDPKSTATDPKNETTTTRKQDAKPKEMKCYESKQHKPRSRKTKTKTTRERERERERERQRKRKGKTP